MTVPDPIAGIRPVLLVMSDLLFRSKIDEVARRLGLTLKVAKSAEQLARQLEANAPALAIVDLECETIDPALAIGQSGAARPGTRILGYAGHTNIGAIRRGQDAGAAQVLARSAFTTQLPALLGRVLQDEQQRPTSPG